MNNKKFIETNELERILSIILKKEHTNLGKVVVLNRVFNDYSSTFPSEIVTCQFFSGLKLKLFCKYINKYNNQNSFLHQNGIEYEHLIYKILLNSMKIKYPKFYGSSFDQTKKNVVLVLEYLENTSRFNQVPSTIFDATKWIAKFHKKSQNKINSADFSFLKRYDLNYYAQWANRALEFTPNQIKQKFHWLPQLCENYKSNLHLLLDDKASIIHGEYYPNNVLIYKRQITPIDWESVGIANGVLDLASLTEGWNKNIVEECIFEYRKLMDENLNENKFIKRFEFAQIYWHLRWLGKWLEETKGTINLKDMIWRYEKLFENGKKLKFIPETQIFKV